MISQKKLNILGSNFTGTQETNICFTSTIYGTLQYSNDSSQGQKCFGSVTDFKTPVRVLTNSYKILLTQKCTAVMV